MLYFQILTLATELALLNLAVARGTTMLPQTNTTNNRAASQSDINSQVQALERDIEFLTREVQGREKSAATWATWYVRMAGATVIVAGLLFFVQFVSHLKQRSFEAVQGKLLKLKDDQLQLELKAGDIRANDLASQTEELKGKNLALEAEISPRRLSDRQKNALSELTAFSGRLVGIKSYSGDTEGAILATQILTALQKSKIEIEDDRLTVLPSEAQSVAFGVSVEGTDEELVKDLKRILSLDGNLTVTSSLPSFPSGVLASSQSGVIHRFPPPVATVIVGPKPIKRNDATQTHTALSRP
jgi:hypothetical protein